jgi:type VI secretion system protein ImpA
MPETARFVAPIREEQPAGDWLRFDPLYDEIKALREQDDPTLPQGVWQHELKKADWPGVARLCESALETRTKDLQIASWMTEAWMVLYGFPGLERGIRVVATLCRTFWAGVYPLIDDGSVEPRLAPIAWLADKLVLPLKSIPITAANGEETMAYAWRDWESALYLAQAKPAKVADHAVTQSQFMVAVSLTPAPRFAALEAELAAAVSALDELEQALREQLGGEQVPSLAALRKPLVAIQQFVSRVRIERGQNAAVPAGEAPPAEEGTMSEEMVPPSSGGAIASRVEAYWRLREAADYLMRTEPHSPVPYLVRRAVSWGNLSLAELLEELLQKNADLTTINTLLGIRKT